MDFLHADSRGDDRQKKCEDPLDHSGRQRRSSASLFAVRFECSWYRGDAAFNAIRKDFGEDSGAVGCARNALRTAQVGKRDLFLYAHAVEWTKREGIDGKDVAAERCELLAKGAERIRLPRARG